MSHLTERALVFFTSRSRFYYASGPNICKTVASGTYHVNDLFMYKLVLRRFSFTRRMHTKMDKSVNRLISSVAELTSRRELLTPIDHILASYNMRNLSKFYAQAGSTERAAHTLMKLENNSPIVILTGFCTTERHVDNKIIPVAETDGPPGAVLAGETLRKLSYCVSYVADPITCNILRACLKSINADDNCVYQFYARHTEQEQVAEAHRLLHQLKPNVMIAGELCSRNWHDGIRRNMKGKNINKWNPPVDEMLVQFKDKGIIIAVGDGGNEAGMANLKNNIPLATDGKTIIASGVYSDIPITSWNSNLGLQAIASTVAAMKDKFDMIPTAEQVIRTIEAALNAGAVEGITLGKEENSMNGIYATRGVDGFAPFVHASDQDKLRSTLIQMRIKGML